MDFTGSFTKNFNALPEHWQLWLVLAACAAGCLVVLWTKRTGKQLSKGRILALALLAAYILFMLFETVIGRRVGVRRAQFELFWSYGRRALREEIILNYFLFVPFGFLLRVCREWRRPWALVFVGMLFSAGIELCQYLFRIGLFEFDDILGNTIGCLIGVLLGALLLKWKRFMFDENPNE